MSAFEDLVAEIQSRQCPKCHGLGDYDDAEIGDIFFNTYPCTPCKGSGFKDGQAYQATPVPNQPARQGS